MIFDICINNKNRYYDRRKNNDELLHVVEA